MFLPFLHGLCYMDLDGPCYATDGVAGCAGGGCGGEANNIR